MNSLNAALAGRSASSSLALAFDLLFLVVRRFTDPEGDSVL